MHKTQSRQISFTRHLPTPPRCVEATSQYKEREGIQNVFWICS